MIVRNQVGLDGLRREAWFSDCPSHGPSCNGIADDRCLGGQCTAHCRKHCDGKCLA
jgi:hypothetical protein